MLIFDAHLDLAFNAVDWNRDLRMDLAEIRGQEGTLQVPGPGRRHRLRPPAQHSTPRRGADPMSRAPRHNQA